MKSLPTSHFLITWALLAIVSGTCCANEATSDRRPNVVVFMIDDLGWQDLSLALGPEVTSFNRRYRTPNVERLARNGTTFTDAYSASPVCTPSRTAFMTGLHPARTGITYWTLRADSDTSSRHPGLKQPPWRLKGLDDRDITLAKLLRDSGYRTIHVGKAHFGAIGTPGEDPTNLGFDVNVAGHAPGGPGSFYGIHDFGAMKRQGKDGPSVWDVPGLESVHGQDVYLTEVLAERATDEIDQALEANRPFFLHFAPYAVHAPIMANHRHLHRYQDLHPREAAYATMIESMDSAIGHVLDHLEDLDLLEETIIVFASDNGGLSAHARGGERHIHNAPLRSGKGSAYEGGVRVPLIVSAANQENPRGRRISTPVSVIDLFPTILEMTSTPAPPDHLDTIDGTSLAGIITDNPISPRPADDRILAWHMPHQWGASGPGIEPFTSIRRGSWKLLYFHHGPRIELYDLAADLSETRDLASERPAIAERLLDDLQAWIEDTGADLSIDTATNTEITSPADFARTMNRN